MCNITFKIFDCVNDSGNSNFGECLAIRVLFASCCYSNYIKNSDQIQKNFDGQT